MREADSLRAQKTSLYALGAVSRTADAKALAALQKVKGKAPATEALKARSFTRIGSLRWAEEVTQDTFVRAYTHLDQFDEHRPFYPWLATIAVRLAQNWLGARHASGRTNRLCSSRWTSLPQPAICLMSSSLMSAACICGDLWQGSLRASALPSCSTIVMR